MGVGGVAERLRPPGQSSGPQAPANAAVRGQPSRGLCSQEEGHQGQSHWSLERASQLPGPSSWSNPKPASPPGIGCMSSRA